MKKPDSDKCNIKAKFTKIGGKIKMELPFRIFCSEQRREFPRSYCFDAADLAWNDILTAKDRKELDKGPILKQFPLSRFFQDGCDGPRLYKMQ